MKNNDEVWYCVNSKGHKIPPYQSNYHVPKPQAWIKRNKSNLYFLLLFILFWGGLITLQIIY